MKAPEIRDLSVEELVAKSNELRGELFNVRVKRATGQLENVIAVFSHRQAAGLERRRCTRPARTAGRRGKDIGLADHSTSTAVIATSNRLTGRSARAGASRTPRSPRGPPR